MKNGFSTAAVIVVIALIVGAGYLWRSKLWIVLDKGGIPHSSATPSTSVSPTPTITPITGWQFYTDNELGFRVQYPETWEKSVEDNTVYFTPMNSTGSGYLFYIQAKNISLADFIKEYENSDSARDENGNSFSKVEKQEKYILDGRNATKLTASTAIGLDQNFIFYSAAGKTLILRYTESDQTNLTILSSFKFIK